MYYDTDDEVRTLRNLIPYGSIRKETTEEAELWLSFLELAILDFPLFLKRKCDKIKIETRKAQNRGMGRPSLCFEELDQLYKFFRGDKEETYIYNWALSQLFEDPEIIKNQINLYLDACLSFESEYLRYTFKLDIFTFKKKIYERIRKNK